ncbi:MAG: hypothetical protein GYB32_03550 [Algicola sp.]|nr:hypothetical protein [Algicola sp.]
MAPIKFDENIKQKLEKRTLQPSADAWGKLEDQLESRDKRKSKGLFLYVGIAASLVGVLLVTTLFFKSPESSNISPVIVETEMKTDVKKEPVMKSQQDKLATELFENIDDNIKTNEDVLEMNTSVTTRKEESELLVASQNVPKVNVIEEDPKISIHNSETTVAAITQPQKEKVLATMSLEEAKVIEVVQEIKRLELQEGTVSDSEIEALLKQAEKEILRERIYSETTRTVDARALLEDVEYDIEQSFRTRVFESLKSSYRTVKTAVAERNQ